MPLASLPKVLVLHGSREVRDSIESSLSPQFGVRKIPDSESAWQSILVDPNICALISSLPLLELDGYGLLQRVRGSRVPRVRSLPVMILSEADTRHIEAQALSFGATDVIENWEQGTSVASRVAQYVGDSHEEREGHQPRLRSIPAAVLPFPGTNRRTFSPPPGSEFASPARGDPEPTPQTPLLEKETPMARFDELTKVLKTLLSSSPGVEASALISTDGLMIASALPQGLDDTRVAGMTATLLNLGTRASTEFQRGAISEVIVRGEQGYAVMISAGRGALLLVLATESTPLGMIFFDMREAIKSIKTIL